MKALDLHIHTIPTIKDSKFEFCLNNLERYVREASLDAIAITNHNIFDIEQFIEIKNKLEIKVFPGIEIDLEKGHILLISETDNLMEFNLKCKEIENKIKTKHDTLSIEEFNRIFYNLDDYLLIPHIAKKPKIGKEVMELLGNHIFAGEVGSIKSFLSIYKDNVNTITPLWFSDSRIDKEYNKIKQGRTFISTQNIDIKSLKIALKDKTKVQLSKEEGNKLFLATQSGLELSTGLNIVIGSRSSGKTYLLDSINQSNRNAKYIKQFELLEDKFDVNEKKFNNKLFNEYSLKGEEYLSNFKKVVEDVINININTDEKNIEEYIKSLKKHAEEIDRRDIFSKAKLFNEEQFIIKNTKNIDNLIESVLTLLRNIEYKKIIDKNIDRKELISLLIELSEVRIELANKNKLQQIANVIIEDISKKLEMESVSTKIINADFEKYLINLDKINKFNEIVNGLVKSKTKVLKMLPNFQIVCKISEYKNATDIRNSLSTKTPLAEAFESYKKPYEYLLKLKELEIPNSEIYKYFVKLEYQVLNKYSLKVSGGERAEFNLINTITDGQNNDILLIDEPESSFDNIFLSDEVNQLLKKLSREMPVVIVTHNNTVALSIKPDYIIHTLREIDSEIKFHVFSGNSSNKVLCDIKDNKNTIKMSEVLIDCLEAGETTYIERREYYGIY